MTDLDASGTELAQQKIRTRHALLEQKSLPNLARAISHALGASSAWHRDLFARFGPIAETDVFEDQVLMFRARMIGSVSYVEERLLRYRRDIGLSFQKKDDQLGQYRRHLAILRQRRLDCLAVLPDRKDILKSIDRKYKRREGQMSQLLAGNAVTDPDADDA